MKKLFALLALVAVISVVVLGIVFLKPSSDERYVKDLEKYAKQLESTEYAGALDFMPKPDELGIYKDFQYSVKNKRDILADYCGMALSVKYTADKYAEQKESVMKKYDFLSKPVGDRMPLAEFKVGGFTFHVAESPEFEYPKAFGVVAFSDELNTVLYLFFISPEMDVIAFSADGESPYSEMSDFINRSFDYDFGK